MRPSDLPPPSGGELVASCALATSLHEEIARAGGWIPFVRYMERVLYDERHGYYASGAVRLGAHGDFVTAPELSPLYAEALARQIAQILRPGEAILEFGAGSGALAEALAARFPDTPYLIVEASPALAARQRARLGARVRFAAEPPEGFRGVMVANEVADAIPVHAVAWRETGIWERGVRSAGDGFDWAERPARGELLEAARAIPLEPPYESEIGLRARAWLRAAARRLARGAILVVDYGFPAHEYYHPQRAGGTLMCHRRGRAHTNPFALPGLQDVTAHVDFSALADAAGTEGLDLLGYTSQAGFLIDCGILERLAQQDPADTARWAPLAAAANRLLSVAEMGELYKVLAVGRGVEAPLIGFLRNDRSVRL